MRHSKTIYAVTLDNDDGYLLWVNQQPDIIPIGKKNLIDYEYSLSSEIWEKREKERAEEWRAELSSIECQLFQCLSDLFTGGGSLNPLSGSSYYHFILISMLMFWNVKICIYSTYIAYKNIWHYCVLLWGYKDENKQTRFLLSRKLLSKYVATINKWLIQGYITHE